MFSITKYSIYTYNHSNWVEVLWFRVSAVFIHAVLCIHFSKQFVFNWWQIGGCRSHYKISSKVLWQLSTYIYMYFSNRYFSLTHKCGQIMGMALYRLTFWSYIMQTLVFSGTLWTQLTFAVRIVSSNIPICHFYWIIFCFFTHDHIISYQWKSTHATKRTIWSVTVTIGTILYHVTVSQIRRGAH